MEPIGVRRIHIRSADGNIQHTTSGSVRKNPTHEVHDYLELSEHISQIQFDNPQYLFLFRGQGQEYFRINATTIKPSIFRGQQGNLPDISELQIRYGRLQRAEEYLVQKVQSKSFRGKTRLARQRVMRWSILQHYETCLTPLLDVSQSLRIAASFATHDFIKKERKPDDRAILYVLAIPGLFGAVAGSIDAGIQTIRLASVCPPEAMRPHLQEGFLIGEYPELADVRDKMNYPEYEVDVANRLVAKFSFLPQHFWKNSPEFPLIDRAALYPDERDPFFEMMAEIKADLPEGTLL